jgi:dihydrofolate reductase
MRKLIESTLVSLDGVIESPERWAIFDEEATQRSMQELDNYDAFVMGRVTYERFRDNWSSSSGNPYFDRIAAMTKYVASRSLDDVTWNASLLGPDIVTAIQDLKAQPGKDLIKYGTAASMPRCCAPGSSTSSESGSCPSPSAVASASSRTSRRRLSS